VLGFQTRCPAHLGASELTPPWHNHLDLVLEVLVPAIAMAIASDLANKLTRFAEFVQMCSEIVGAESMLRKSELQAMLKSTS
jgi:hypothetical protein